MANISGISTTHHLLSGNKHRIKLAFSNAAPAYDSLAVLQEEVADGLLKGMIFPLPVVTMSPFNVLDIGCGTGLLTYKLAKLLPEANIFGCDIAHAMVEMARLKNSNKKLHLLTADAEFLPYKNETFHMAASNLAYQWVPFLESAFLEVWHNLKPGGLFIFATLGAETLRELQYCYVETSTRFNKDGLPPFMRFLEEKNILLSLKEAGFGSIAIKRTENIQIYQDMWTLLKTLKSIGAGNPFKKGDKSLARGRLLKNMAELYKEKFTASNSVYATYEVIYINAIKPRGKRGI